MDSHVAAEKLLEELKSGPTSFIAGIGSRKLPVDKSEILFKAAFLSVLTEKACFTSGGAPGSDTTCEHGVRAALQAIATGQDLNSLINTYLKVYLPGFAFNGRFANNPGMIDASKLPRHEEAKELARSVHPATKDGKYELKPYVLKLHARNGHQALGDNLDKPVRVIQCFTGDGAKGSAITKKTGGTGQALRLADKFSIPVLNIGNKGDEVKLAHWIQKRGDWLLEKYGIDVHKAHHDYVANFTSGIDHHVGDLIEDIEALDLDVIVHDCNCFNIMGSGTALEIKTKFPNAYYADQETKKGDRSKLGSYSISIQQGDKKEFVVVNAYTQYRHEDNGSFQFDYEAFESVLKKLNDQFPGAKVGFPRIGSDQSGGCWLSIAEMIKNKAPRLNPVIISRPCTFSYLPKPAENGIKKKGQRSLDL